MSSKGEIRGKLRVNLECGSAQPSLFIIPCEPGLPGHLPHHRHHSDAHVPVVEQINLVLFTVCK